MIVVAEAESGDAAIECIKFAAPQVAILDVAMNGEGSGFEVARAVREERLSVAVVFLTMYKDERVFNAAL